MPNYKKSHEENRKKVCVICFDKNKSVRPVTANQENVIQSTILGYRRSSMNFPSGICNTCRVYICKYGEGYTEHVSVFDYQKNRVIFKRSDGPNCFCIICLVARLTLHEPNIYLTKNSPPGRTSISSKFCMKCFSTIRRGISHDCTLGKRKKNLKIIADNEGLCLSRVTNTTRVTTEDMIRIRTRLNLSMNGVKILSYELRHCNDTYSRSLVEPNILNQMAENSHNLDNYFTSKIKSGIVYIYCTDICSLVNYIV